MTQARSLAMGAAFLLVAGCNLLPPQLHPPSIQGSNPEEQARQSAAKMQLMDVAIDLKIGVSEGGRAVQFNGGQGALQNDIANLVVGLFDNGTVAAANASLGYLYTGAVGVASPTPDALTAANAPYIGVATYGIQAKLGSSGTLGSITSDKANLRRYLIRDFGPGTGFVSNSTTVRFRNIPAMNGSGVHNYIIFAAAYDSSSTLLGYTEDGVTQSQASGATDSSANTLTLNLNAGVFTNNLGETPILVPFVPSAI